jgi:hypothetical protein
MIVSFRDLGSILRQEEEGKQGRASTPDYQSGQSNNVGEEGVTEAPAHNLKVNPQPVFSIDINALELRDHELKDVRRRNVH